MDVQDQSKHTTPTGHESHGVHLCHRCGWPFPNPHPSARHRRSHKKICGTIDGYTNLIHSEDVSDDERHPDDDKDKTPSPKIEKKTSIGGGGGAIGRSFSRSEDDSFSDAVTDFSDTASTGSVHKNLDRDLFFSFKDAENGEISKVDSSEAKSKLPETDGKSLDGLVKDGVVEPVDVSQSQEAKFIDVVGTGVKVETVTADEEIKHEKSESECEHVSEAELVHEHGAEVAKKSEIDRKVEGFGEETKHERLELDHEQGSEAVKEPETVFVLTEKDDLVAPKSENCSPKEIDEVVKEPKSVLTEKEDLVAPISKKHSIELPHESVLTEKVDLGGENIEKNSKEDTMEVVQEPNSTLIEKEDLGAPKSEKSDLDEPESENCSNKLTHEVAEEPKTVLTEKDLGAPNLEKHSNEHTHEVFEAVLIKKEDLGAQNMENLPKEDTQEEAKVDNCIVNDKNVSSVVSEPIIGKLVTNQDSAVDLSVDSSSRNSLEGNWGSVSVLSTASLDDKAKAANSGKLDNSSGTSDVLEPPSFMTLVEPQGKDQKHEVQDAEKAGWFPTITNVSNEYEGRKKNEEVIAKVTNWSTGKHSAPLKNLLGEAKSPNAKEPETVAHKDEGATEKVNQELLSSPPKLIADGKKVGKKAKGRSSWMPFGCCSSVNVVN